MTSRQFVGLFGPDATDEEIAAAIQQRQVSKHAQHNQKDHGNWADGTTKTDEGRRLKSSEIDWESQPEFPVEVLWSGEGKSVLGKTPIWGVRVEETAEPVVGYRGMVSLNEITDSSAPPTFKWESRGEVMVGEDEKGTSFTRHPDEVFLTSAIPSWATGAYDSELYSVQVAVDLRGLVGVTLKEPVDGKLDADRGLGLSIIEGVPLSRIAAIRILDRYDLYREAIERIGPRPRPPKEPQSSRDPKVEAQWDKYWDDKTEYLNKVTDLSDRAKKLGGWVEYRGPEAHRFIASRMGKGDKDPQSIVLYQGISEEAEFDPYGIVKRLAQIKKHGGGSHDDKSHGSWADGSSAQAASPDQTNPGNTETGQSSAQPASAPTTGSGTQADPFVTSDVDFAAEALANGQYVRLNRNREVSTLIDKLADIARQAEAAGEQAPNFDLCRVSVAGTNIFCSEHKGVRRIDMPQISGKALPGTEAASFVDPASGEVNGAAHFRAYLVDRGIFFETTTEKASFLRASQMELVGTKVAGMMDATRAGKWNAAEEPIFISNDGYVVDGHHRWAAIVGLDLSDDVAGDLDMNVVRIDLPITDILPLANEFANHFGIAPKIAKRRSPCATPILKHTMASDPQTSQVFESTLMSHGSRLAQVTATTEPLLSQPGTRRGSDTMGLYGLWEGNNFIGFTPERAEFQADLLRTLEADQVLANDALDPAPDRQAIVMVGLPGSGKSTLLRRHLGSLFDPRQFVIVDADELKERLLTDEVVVEGADLTGMELSPLTHMEANALAGAWEYSLVSRGLNLAVDIVGSDPERTVARIERLKAAGYTVHVIFCDVTTDEAVASTLRRSAEGGRPVPPEYVRSLDIAGSAELVAQAANGQVVWYRTFPVSGQEPQLVDIAPGTQSVYAGSMVTKHAQHNQDDHGNWADGSQKQDDKWDKSVIDYILENGVAINDDRSEALMMMGGNSKIMHISANARKGWVPQNEVKNEARDGGTRRWVSACGREISDVYFPGWYTRPEIEYRENHEEPSERRSLCKQCDSIWKEKSS